MRELKSTCRAAVVQATPVMFDKSKCLEKALRLADRLGGHLVSDSRMRPTSVATGFDELDCSLPRCAAGREALPAMPFVFERREEGSGTGVTVTRSGSPRRKPCIVFFGPHR